MDALNLRRHFIAAIAKHLPPSSASMRLLDLDGRAGPALAKSRADLDIRHIPADEAGEIDIAPSAYDAAVAFDLDLDDALLAACLTALREGGRLIAVQSRGLVCEAHMRRLRGHGYVRILVEPALDELGLLIRGEKPHSTADTMARIQSVARADADSLDLSRFGGRYIHLLIQQQPNKPVWKLAMGEAIRWRAAAVQRDLAPVLLGFSSLPKAVGFMQPAVLSGFITGVNKVGKFSIEGAGALERKIILNPALESIAGETMTFVDIDPALAEAPDE